MTNLSSIPLLLAAAAIAAVLIFVTRTRQKSHQTNQTALAQDLVCQHLKPALDLLLQRGNTVVRVGQKHPELPLEIHLQPAFDPTALQNELELSDPVFLSPERHVLFCKEDFCELHPTHV